MNMLESMAHIEHNFDEKTTTDKQIVVIKIGGSVLGDIPIGFYKDLLDLTTLGWLPVIVHGGGPSITNMLNILGIKSEFINGLRKTDAKTLEIAQMTLIGKENKEIIRSIQRIGGKAIGISGIDNEMIKVEPINENLGYVGRIIDINLEILYLLMSKNIIPVISPLGVDKLNQVYNINSDTVAQAIAIKLNAKKILMVSDIPGIYSNNKGERNVLHLLTPNTIDKLKRKKQISGGMIPKIEAAVECLKQGIEEIYILNGQEEGILAKVYERQIVGTKILEVGVV